jgi:hypothetical protein
MPARQLDRRSLSMRDSYYSSQETVHCHNLNLPMQQFTTRAREASKESKSFTYKKAVGGHRRSLHLRRP